MKLGDNIRAYRIHCRLTQRELAEKLSVSTSAIGMYEQNRRIPDLMVLREMAQMFRTSIDSLIGEEGTMRLNKEKFLESELGMGLEACVIGWDYWLTGLRKFSDPTLPGYKNLEKEAEKCQAQWEVYKMVLRQLYGIEYCFSRTDEYYGVCTEDEQDWLFKVERRTEDECE